MIAVAAAIVPDGLISRLRDPDLNVRSAYLHMLGDFSRWSWWWYHCDRDRLHLGRSVS